ncbi:MAG: hypothetical protein Q7T55_04955, partial [Solirubrobacteraceae bacterium]|nr:hypothetical protein [Solirubrobacteraceae bacterium]
MSTPDPWSGTPADEPVGGALSPSPLASPPLLMGIPNVSEGRDPAIVDVIGQAYVAGGAALLATHQDVDHHRSVHTLAAPQGVLARALAAGAATAIEQIDLTADRGLHPRVGALDVCPVVFLDEGRAGAAIAEALLTAQLIGELGVPVLLYGELAGGRTRAFLRRGGTPELIRRVGAGELKPDFGPSVIDPRHGAVLVAARP